MASVKSGRVTVPTAGTRVAFPQAPKKCVWLLVEVVKGNTGALYFGDAAVSATTGLSLYGGTDGVHSFVEIPFGNYGGVDLNSLYLDVEVSGESADFLAVLE